MFDNSSLFFCYLVNYFLSFRYEVKFQNALECGGAYIKLLVDSADLQLDNFLDKTPYSIMFGPDKCGADSKVRINIIF